MAKNPLKAKKQSEEPASLVEIADRHLDAKLGELIQDPKATQLLIACPFIRDEGVKVIVDNLSKRKEPVRLMVITKFDMMDFVTGASQLSAIRTLFELPNDKKMKVKSATVRASTGLHAKLT